MVFHLSEHFLENSAKLTDKSGCFLCSSRHVCTKKAYEDILPSGLLGSPLPIADSGTAATWRERVPPRLTRTLPSPSSGKNWSFSFLNIHLECRKSICFNVLIH
ncbi:hypothetical protein LEMLEM_LOCUS22804, partial [Lemmus lemmus]